MKHTFLKNEKQNEEKNSFKNHSGFYWKPSLHVKVLAITAALLAVFTLIYSLSGQQSKKSEAKTAPHTITAGAFINF